MEQKEVIEGSMELLFKHYRITTMGQLFSKRSQKMLIPSKRHNGYVQFNVWIGGKQHTFLAHRLVAIKFIPNPFNLPEVNHKDGNKENNNHWNLEWASRPDNIQHGFDSGLITPAWKGKSGASHSRSKAVFQLKDNQVVGEYGSAREASRTSGICYGTISNVLTGKGKTAGGFNWKYISEYTNP